MGQKHKKYKSEWRAVEGNYEDKQMEKPLKLVLKVGGSEVTELSGSGHDSSYYDDRSDHERQKKKKKKKSEKEKDKHVDDEERRRRKEEKKKKREREQLENAANATAG